MANIKIDESGNLYIGSEMWRELKQNKATSRFAIVVSMAKHLLIQGKSFRVQNDHTDNIDRSCDRMSELQDEVGEDYPLKDVS